MRRRSPVSTSFPALALACLIGLTIAGCASLPAQSPRGLLIGLDGGDWNVLQPLIAGGAHGDLDSMRWAR
jgi:hypothetical protein